MRVRVIVVVTLALCLQILILFPLVNKAQTKCVKIKFEVDGKRVPGNKFKVLIYADGHGLQSRLTADGFVVPDEVSTAKKLEVRFVAGRYDLFFGPLTKHHFDSEWVIGVSNPPFKEEPDLPLLKDGKELHLVYHIEFRPKHAEGTKWISRIYK